MQEHGGTRFLARQDPCGGGQERTHGLLAVSSCDRHSRATGLTGSTVWYATEHQLQGRVGCGDQQLRDELDRCFLRRSLQFEGGGSGASQVLLSRSRRSGGFDPRSRSRRCGGGVGSALQLPSSALRLLVTMICFFLEM